MRTYRKVAYLFLMLLSIPGWSVAEEAIVLDVRAEGVVVDTSQMPDARPGAKLAFVRVEGARTEVGHGLILDTTEGRALVQSVTGNTRQGDLAVLCPKPEHSDAHRELRAIADQLRAQPGEAAIKSPDRMGAIGEQLKVALDSRETAVKQGACDTAELDAQIFSLAMELKNSGSDLQPRPDGSRREISPEVAIQSSTPPSPETHFGAGMQTSVAGSEKGSVETAVDALDKISKIVERIVTATKFKGGQLPYSPGASPDLGMGTQYPGYPSDVAPGQYQSPPYSNPGTESQYTPPAYPPDPNPGNEYPLPSPDPSGSNMGGQSLPPSYPTDSGIGGQAPPPAPNPPSSPQFTLHGRITEFGGNPVGGAAVSAIEWNQTTSTDAKGNYYLKGPRGQVTLKATAPGYEEATQTAVSGVANPFNLVLKKIGVIPTPPTAVLDPVRPTPGSVAPKFGDLFAGEKSNTSSGNPATVPWWQVPGTKTPNPQPTAASKDELGKTAIGLLVKIRPATVTGRVMNEKGQPLPGARVSVSSLGATTTSSEGKFSLQNITPGQHQLTVVATGFRPQTRTITLQTGEIETISFTLQRLVVSPVATFPKHSTKPQTKAPQPAIQKFK